MAGNHRRRNEPPAKFAFLRGIDPDLDEALCEAHSVKDEIEERELYSSSSHRRSARSNRLKQSDRSRSMSYYEEKDPYQTRRSSTGTCRVNDLDVESPMSVASKPKEITCSLNDTIESLPFSIDGMEKAKRKIRSQAAKIKDLEAQLKRSASLSGENMTQSIQSTAKKSNRRILSPEERLEAHKQRKRVENKYKEKSGKWETPPPLKNTSIVSKVKRNDDLVDRVTANPIERRRQEEVKRRQSRSARKSSRSVTESEYIRDESPLVRRQSLEEEVQMIGSNHKSKNSGRKGGKQNKKGGRDSLMRRLNMGVEERRSLERNDILDAAKRVSRRKNERLNAEEPDHDSIYRKESIGKSRNVVRCQTCGSTKDCEEDTDDPGTFYCSLCWDEYEDENNLDRGFEDESDEESTILSALIVEEVDEEVDDEDLSSSTVDNNAIWVVHDNPKLASRLVCSGPSKMSCFIETKDPRIKNCVRILHGSIDYSGPVQNSGGRYVRSVDATDRGSECIRVANICGYTVRYDKVQTRLDRSDSVHEFQLDHEDGIPLTGQNAKMTVKEFLHGCEASVDVILDPQSNNGWYPIIEAASSRKIAPQFRSKGVGYIRLGDDMGKNGLAFISSDYCKTFFIDAPTQDVNSDLLRSVSSFSSKPSHASSSSSYRANKPIKNRNLQPRSSSTKTKMIARCEVLSEEDDSSVASEVSQIETLNAGEILKELQNLEGSKDFKWSDKAELIIKLGNAIENPESRSWCEGTLNYIQDIISAKNVNIHVLRSALIVVDKVGHVLESELPNHIAWKTIMIEILKLLKNKQCGGGAREILQKLHGRSFTLANSLVAISHVLGMGKTLTTSQRKINVNKKNPTPQLKANNVEIIEWLAVTTEAERLLDKVDPVMDYSELELLASFFLSHESHRDARCRKNALDGLLHTMLYGVEILGLDISEVQSLCLELKTNKPKSWARLNKSLLYFLRQ